MKTEYYTIPDCENENDIERAKKEIIDSGGIIDGVFSEDKEEDIDDYYEGKNWYIAYHKKEN